MFPQPEKTFPPSIILSSLVANLICIIPEYRLVSAQLSFTYGEYVDLAQKIYEMYIEESFQERIRKLIQFSKTFSKLRIRPLSMGQGVILEVYDRLLDEWIKVSESSTGMRYILLLFSY